MESLTVKTSPNSEGPSRVSVPIECTCGKSVCFWPFCVQMTEENSPVMSSLVREQINILQRILEVAIDIREVITTGNAPEPECRCQEW